MRESSEPNLKVYSAGINGKANCIFIIAHYFSGNKGYKTMVKYAPPPLKQKTIPDSDGMIFVFEYFLNDRKIIEQRL